MTKQMTCSVCYGKGRLLTNTCPVCEGTGMVQINVDIEEEADRA